jgi:hypothetical protein
MGKICVCFVLLVFLLPSGVGGATLENLDLKRYRIEIRFADDTIIHQTVHEQGSLYGLCDYGCLLVLMETGQTLEVRPEDYIVIEDGALKRRE